MADPTTTPDPSGIDHAAEAMKRYEAATAAAEKRVAMLEARLKSPVVQAQTAALDRQVKLEEKLNLQARNRQYAMGVESGAAARHLQTVQHLNREYDLQQMRVRNQAAAADLASGAHMRHAKALAEVNREGEKIRRQQEVQNLVAQHGRLGGAARAAAPHLMVAGRGMMGMLGLAGIAGGLSMVRSGLSGTAEGVRLEYQWTRLSRQLASVAIPAFEKLGNVVGRVAGYFESLNGRQQDWFLKLGLGLVIIPPVFMALRALGLAGIAATAALRAVSVAAVPAAAVGTGAAAVGGTAVAAGAAGAAARGGMLAAAAPYALGGAVGAVGHEMGLGHELTAAAGGLGLAKGLIGSKAPGLTRLGTGLRAAGKFMLPVGIGMSAMEGGDMFGKMRESGKSWAGSASRALAHGVVDFFSLGFVDLYDDPRMKGKEGEKKRRDVTPFGNMEGELGSAAGRVQQEILRALVARKEEREAEKEIAAAAEAMREAAAELRKAADRDGMGAGVFGTSMAERARDIAGR